MGYRIGSGYFGSPSLQTSTGNQEIIQQHNFEGASIPLKAYKMSFMNTQACTIKINNSTPIYIPAGDGFECDGFDAPISTFVIMEANITYCYICAY